MTVERRGRRKAANHHAATGRVPTHDQQARGHRAFGPHPPNGSLTAPGWRR